MNDLLNRIAVVTGASSGIGKSIAQTLAAAGAKVVLVSTEAQALLRTETEIGSAGGICKAIEADIPNEQQVMELFIQTANIFGRVDLLVNNAGVAIVAALDEIKLADWQTVINVNLTGAFLCSREAFKITKQQICGRIINIGSVSSKVPRPNSVS